MLYDTTCLQNTAAIVDSNQVCFDWQQIDRLTNYRCSVTHKPTRHVARCGHGFDRPLKRNSKVSRGSWSEATGTAVCP